MSMLLRRYHSKEKGRTSNANASSFFVDKNKDADVKYTRTDISRMNKEELVNLALKNGIDNAHEMSGTVLKQILFEKYGL